MDLTVLSGAATIALASTIILLLVIRSWAAFTKSTTTTRFPESIMLEAAQRIRDKLTKLSQDQSVYLVSALVFTVVFCIFYLIPPQGMFDDVPRWQLILVLVLLGIAAAFLVFRIAQTVVAKRKLLFYRDASMATGHALQRLTANRNRVSHDVPTAAGTIDNVIVGLQGVYTVSVIARKAGKKDRAALKGDRLSLGEKYSISVKRSAVKSEQLAKEIRKATGNDIRVRSVIAIPGWEIESQQSSEFLVVNERNLAMLTGWKDQKDYLMNEDVEAVQDLLTKRCTRFVKK
jgi:Ca2+/Na+ antiporter